MMAQYCSKDFSQYCLGKVKGQHSVVGVVYLLPLLQMHCLC